MKTALIILAFIALSALTYMGFYNTFYQPKFSIKEEGNEIIVYKHTEGHYHLTDSVMKSVFNEVYENKGIVVTKGFGYYFNNPEIAGETNISFNAGCIIENEDSSKTQLISEKFSIEKTPFQQYIVSDFPLKGRMSIMIGMKKVYPKLDQFCEENGYKTDVPVMEIYDRVEKKIHYRRKLVELE